MNELLKGRLRKAADGLDCCKCPLKRCVGRCTLYKTLDLIEEQEKELLIKEAEITRLRRMIESEVEE